MTKEHADLDEMQRGYQVAVEEWIGAIRREEELAMANPSLAAVDRWEAAHFDEPSIASRRRRPRASPRCAPGSFTYRPELHELNRSYRRPFLPRGRIPPASGREV